MARRKSVRRRKRGMFYEPPRHKWLAEIITIVSPTAARQAVKKLLAKAKKANRKVKLLIKRAMVLAANRAAAMRKKKNPAQKRNVSLSRLRKSTEKRTRKLNCKFFFLSYY